MDIRSFFSPVREIPATDVKRAVEGSPASEYVLVDVREPHEFARGHLPGALLIPLGELPSRTDEIERGRPVYAYCQSGNRSRSAAGILSGAGFTHAASMRGGIAAYEGRVAVGGLETGMALIPPGSTPAEICALAWLLEHGTGRFYASLEETVGSGDAADLFHMLMAAEEGHKSTIIALYTELSGGEPGEDFPAGIIKMPEVEHTEGGVPLSAAISWAKGKSAAEIVELMMALEANAYDLYVRIQRMVANEHARHILESIAGEERVHLERLGALLADMEK